MQNGKGEHDHQRGTENERGVRHWELAHELGVSEQTLVRLLRFQLSEDKQMEMLEKIEAIVKRKENVLDN